MRHGITGRGRKAIAMKPNQDTLKGQIFISVVGFTILYS